MAQVLPKADSFDAGSPVYDSAVLTSYVRDLPIVTDPAYGSGGSGFALALAAWSNVAKLYTGWFGQDPGSINPNVATNTIEHATGTTAPTGWLWRDFSGDDVSAAIAWQLQSNASVPAILAAPRKNYVGIIARAIGGTLQSGGTVSARYEGGSCYMGCAFFDPATGGKFLILRVNNGVVTRLADYPAGSGNFLTWVQYEATLQTKLALEVSTTGGLDVSLALKLTTSSRVPPTTVVSYVDTDIVQKLLLPGRCGFFLGSERIESSIMAAPCLDFFECGVLGDSPTLRDEWQRIMPGASRLVISPAFFNGRTLTCLWAWDLWRGTNSGANVLQSDTANNRAKIDSQSAIATGWTMSQRASTSAYSQDRKATFQFKSGALVPNPSVRSCGIFVRGAHLSPTTPLDSGYYVEVRRDDQATTTEIRLWRQIAQTGTMIARKTGVSIALDTNFEINLTASNRAIPDPTTGEVILRVYLDTVLVALTPAAVPPAGVSVSAFGVVVDGSSSRIQSGYGEGLYFVNPNTSQRPITVDTWDEGSSVVVIDPNDGDEESIEVLGEAAIIDGTLELYEAWPIENVTQLFAYRHELESDHVSARPRQSRARETWRVTLDALDTAEIDALRDFVVDHAGCVVAFYWTPPELSDPVACHFAKQSQVDTLLAPGVFNGGELDIEVLFEEQ